MLPIVCLVFGGLTMLPILPIFRLFLSASLIIPKIVSESQKSLRKEKVFKVFGSKSTARVWSIQSDYSMALSAARRVQTKKKNKTGFFVFVWTSLHSIIPLYLWMTSRKSSQIQQISFHFSHMHLVGRSNPQNLNNIPRLSNKHLASKQDLKSEL